jgi:hypothetical protein
MTPSDEDLPAPGQLEEDAKPKATGAQGGAGDVGGAPVSHDGDAEGDGGDEGGPVETAEAVIESAAGFVVAAAVAPFAAGETGPILGSIHDAVEEGIQRLTHLGHHHDETGTSAHEAEAQPEADPAPPTPEAAGPAEPPEDDPPA